MSFRPLPSQKQVVPYQRSGKFLDIEVYGEIEATGGTISGDMTVTGDMTISGDQTVSGDIDLSGDIYSDGWVGGGGTVPISLPDASATAGFAMEGTTGRAQFEDNVYLNGDVTIAGNQTVTGNIDLASAGVFSTNANAGIGNEGGEQGINLYSTERNVARFFSGDSAEDVASVIQQGTNGTSSTRTVQLGIFSPIIDADTSPSTNIDARAYFAVRSGSPDHSTYAPGVIISEAASASGTGQTPIFQIQNEIPTYTSGDINLTAGDINLTAGDINIGAGGSVGFGTSFDDAIHQTSDGVLEFEIGGTSELTLNSSGLSGPAVEWSAWTPSYTNITKGNAPSESARYTRIGDTVIAKFRLVFGSTSAMGTAHTISLPVNSNHATGETPIGWGYAIEAGGSQYPLIARQQAAGTVRLFAHDTTGSYAANAGLSSTVPFTWGTSDILRFTVVYEAA